MSILRFAPTGNSTTYAAALILLMGIKVTFWIELLFPFWILIENFSGRLAFRDVERRTLGAAD